MLCHSTLDAGWGCKGKEQKGLRTTWSVAGGFCENTGNNRDFSRLRVIKKPENSVENNRSENVGLMIFKEKKFLILSNPGNLKTRVESHHLKNQKISSL
jgi:hypothetical protein